MNSFESWCLRVLAPWTRLNARHPWSHNDAYGWWIAHRARGLGTRHPRIALDVGCGTGNVLARVAGVVDEGGAGTVLPLHVDLVTIARRCRSIC